MEISYTKLRVYLECPWLYKLRFIEGQRTALTPAASLGLSLHRALERFHREPGGQWDDLEHCYKSTWLAAGYPDDSALKRGYAKGLRILKSYFELDCARRSEIVSVEREFVYSLGRHTVRGMIDRIDRLADGRHEIIDYKTHLDFMGEEELADNLQLRFYALGARESLAIKIDLLTIFYVAAGRRVSAAYDPSAEEQLKILIADTADRIESGAMPPRTLFCPACDFKKECPHCALGAPH